MNTTSGLARPAPLSQQLGIGTRSKRLFSAILTIFLAMAVTLTFSSPASAYMTPAQLGTAQSFSVLGGQSVTNTGPTTLSGDLGVSPGTAITGFPPGIVNGTTHEGDAVAAQAQADVTTAYNHLAGLAPTNTEIGDLGGQTLEEGVYSSSSSMSLTGTLILDGQGNPDAVFVFQAGSTLTTASNSNVVLTNGAQACNVYWQVGSSATLGTGTTLAGSILALESITANTGTQVQGRALARNGSVTLDTNSFSDASCVAPPNGDPNGDPAGDPSGDPAGDQEGDPAGDPTVTVDRDEVTPGNDVEIEGEGFTPDSTVEVTITDSDGAVVDTLEDIVVDGDGAFSIRWTVPEGIDAGVLTVTAEDEEGASATSELRFVVDDDEPAGDVDRDGGLATTGSATAIALLALSVVLVLAGIWATRVARSRRMSKV